MIKTIINIPLLLKTVLFTLLFMGGSMQGWSQLQIIGDSTVCDGDSLMLRAINQSSYAWADSLNPTIIISTDSIIYVTPVTTTTYLVYGNNDTASHQVEVIALPLVELGNDTILCPGQSLVLSVNRAQATYLWNDGTTNPVKMVNSGGVYWVEVTENSCTKRDSIVVDEMLLPWADIGNDTAICDGEQIIFNVAQDDGIYLWSDGSTDSSLTLTQQTVLWVEVSNFCGLASETINVVVNPYPVVDLGNDTALCEGETLNLDATNANLGTTYLWNTGDISPQLNVAGSGNYSVSVTIKNCVAVDSIFADFGALPQVYLGEDTIICYEDEIVLKIEDKEGVSYLWHDGTTENWIIADVHKTHWVVVTEGICEASDSVFIGGTACVTHIELPNVFTPNGDGMNDLFTPIYYVAVTHMEYVIYNRWGQQVFTTTNPDLLWDGVITNGDPVPNGVYYWVAYVIGSDGGNYKYDGRVSVFR